MTEHSSAPVPDTTAADATPTAPDIDARIVDFPMTVEMVDGTLILEADIEGSEDQLWQAITDPTTLERWSPIVPERPLTETGPVLSRETPDAEPVAADVLALAPGHALTHKWGDDLVEWLIEPSRLIVQMKVAQPEYVSFYAAGWQVCFAVLDAVLRGEDQPRIVGMDAMDHGWRELNERYADQLGIEVPTLDAE